MNIFAALPVPFKMYIVHLFVVYLTTLVSICTITCYWLDMGLVIRFIGLLKLVTIKKYSAVTNLRTRLLTTTSAVFCVFTSGCLVTDLNNVLLLTSLPAGDCLAPITWLQMSSHSLLTESQIQSYVTTDGQSASLSWCQAPSLAQNQIFVTVSCGFVDVGHPLSRECRSVVCNCCCPSPAQLFSGPSPPGLITIFYWLRLETPPAWRARSPYLYTQGTGWPIGSVGRLNDFWSSPAQSFLVSFSSRFMTKIFVLS
jgi:hypothetical protein